MSTTHVPILFFGVYLDDEDEIQQFLLDYARPEFELNDNESLEDCEVNEIVKLFLNEEDGYVIGIRMEPGESDARAKALWLKTFGTVDHVDYMASPHLDIWIY